MEEIAEGLRWAGGGYTGSGKDGCLVYLFFSFFFTEILNGFYY